MPLHQVGELLTSNDKSVETIHFFKTILKPEEIYRYVSIFDKCEEELGYRAGITDGFFESHLKLFILATMDYSVEDLVNLSNISREDLAFAIREFADKVNFTGHSGEECAGNIAEIHKFAMDKILDFEIPEYRPDNMDSLIRIRQEIQSFSEMCRGLSQDTESLRYSEKFELLRREYGEVYPVEIAEQRELRALVFVEGFYRPVELACEQFQAGNYQNAGFYLDYARQNLVKIRGKKISELPVSLIPVSRDTCARIMTIPKMNCDDEFMKFLDGRTGSFPGRDRMWSSAITGLYPVVYEMSSEEFRKSLERLGKMDFRAALSVLPEDAPRNLTLLPEQTRECLEGVWNRSFGKIFRPSKMMAACNAEKDLFDVLQIDGKSMWQAVMESYGDEILISSESNQYSVMKLEVLRALKTNPDGVQVLLYRFDDRGHSVMDAEPFVLKNNAGALDFNFDLNPQKSGNAEDARNTLRIPEEGVPYGIRAMADTIQKKIDTELCLEQYYLSRRGMDIYDVLFIEDLTVNQIFEGRYAVRFSKISGISENEFKNALIAAESFDSSKIIFHALPVENSEDSGDYTVMPVTFTGTGVTFVQGQSRTENQERIIQNGEKILRKRRELYSDFSKAKTNLINKAKKQVDLLPGFSLMKEMEERLLRIRTYAQFASAPTNVYLEETEELMDGLKTGVLDVAKEYDILKIAANTAAPGEVRDALKAEMKELRKSPVILNYEKLITGLEYSYGVRNYEEELKRDGSELSSFFEKETGSPLGLYAVLGDFSENPDAEIIRYCRPLEISVDNSSVSREVNQGRVADVLKALYLVAKRGIRRGGKYDRNFAKLILIDGKSAVEAVPGIYTGTEKEEETEQYINTVAAAVLETLSEGKEVDFFVRSASDGEAISTVPIHVKTVHAQEKISDAELGINRQNQKDGMEALFENIPFAEESRNEIFRENERLFNQRKALFERYKADLSIGAEDFSKAGNPAFDFKFKYFPELAGLIGKDANTPIFGRKGFIRLDGTLPASYIMLRLCQESEERKSYGEEGYFLEEIMSLKDLKERKEYYAGELREIRGGCLREEYNRNMIASMKAALKMHGELYPVHRMAWDRSFLRNAFSGIAGMLVTALSDFLGEMNIIQNRETQMSLGLFASEEEREEFLQEINALVRISKVLQKEGIALRHLAKLGEFKEDVFKRRHILSGLLIPSLIPRTFRVNETFGRNPYYGMEMAEQFGRNGFEELYYTNPVQIFLNRPDLAKICAEGMVGDYLFFDVEGFMYAKSHESEEERLNSADYVKILNPKYPEKREMLEKSALKRRLDREELDAFNQRMRDHANHCKEIFAKGLDEDELPCIDNLPSVRMTPEEDVERAAEIFDEIFGPVFKREAVSEYLERNRESIFDLLRVGEESVKEYVEAADFSENEMKAEVIRLSMDAHIALTFRSVRMNEEGIPEIVEEENIINPDVMKQLTLELPYLKDFETYRQTVLERTRKQGVEFDYTNAELKQMYNVAIRVEAEKLFTSSHFTTYKKLKASLNSVNPVDFSAAKMETVFGSRPVFVAEFAEEKGNVYSKGQFKKYLPDLEIREVDNHDFATLAYFASLNPDIFDSGKVSDDRISEWTVAFTKDKPGNLGTEILPAVVSPARKAAKKAVEEYWGEDAAQEEKSFLSRILMFGIRKTLSDAADQDSIYDAGGTFIFYARMLHRLDDFLGKNESLRTVIISGLEEEERKRYQSFLQLETLYGEMLEAKERILRTWEESVPDRMDAAVVVGRYEDLARRWKRGAGADGTSRQFRELFAVLDNLGSAEYSERENGNIERVNTLVESVISVIKDYNRVKSISVKNGAGQYTVSREELRVLRRMALDCEFLLKQYKDFIGDFLADSHFGKIQKRCNLRKISSEVQFTNKKGFLKLLNFDYSDEKDLRILLEEVGVELCRVFSEPDFEERFSDIMTCSDRIGEKPEECLVYTCPDRVSEIISELPEILEMNETVEISGEEPWMQSSFFEEINAILSRPKAEIAEYLLRYGVSNEIEILKLGDGVNVLKTYQKGALSNLTYSDNAYIGEEKSNETLKFVDESKAFMVGDFSIYPVTVSIRNRDHLLEILNLMDEENFFYDMKDMLEEEKKKTYGFAGIIEAKKKLAEAVMGNPVSMNEIAQRKEIYEEKCGKMHDIFSRIREYFPEAIPPGNLDGILNPEVPFEFSRDYRTCGIMNGIYLLGMYARECDISFEDVIDNPTWAVEKFSENLINNYGIEERVSGYSNIFEGFNHLYTENISGQLPEYDENSISKALNILMDLEENEETVAELNARIRAVSVVEMVKIRNDRACNKFFEDYKTRDYSNSHLGELFRAGVKNAFLLGRIARYQIPVVTVDVRGVKEEPFNNYESILKMQNLYDRIAERYQSSVEEVTKNTFLNRDLQVALEGALYDYLKAHPEDMNREEYKALEDLARRSAKDLGTYGRTANQADYFRFKNDFVQKAKEVYNSLKKTEKEFNKSITGIIKKIARAQTDLKRNPADRRYEIRYEEVMTEALNAIDSRKLELVMGYQNKTVSTYYLRTRSLQLNSLQDSLREGQPDNAEYTVIPQWLGETDRYYDCKLIADKVNNREWDGHVKDLETFKNWKLHIDEKHEILYEDDVTEEEWQSMYENEILLYAASTVVIPSGVDAPEEIVERINGRTADLENKRNSGKNLKPLPEQEVKQKTDTSGTKFKEGQIKEKKDSKPGVLERAFGPEGISHLIKEKFGGQAKSGTPSAASSGLSVEQIYEESITNPWTEETYRIIAEEVAKQIMSDRNNKISPENKDLFVEKVCKDPSFRMVLSPILDKVYEEFSNNPKNSSGEMGIWAQRLVKMIKTRKILEFYSKQKNLDIKGDNSVEVLKQIYGLVVSIEQRDN